MPASPGHPAVIRWIEVDLLLARLVAVQLQLELERALVAVDVESRARLEARRAVAHVVLKAA
jgi:hypothetical protein